MTVLQFRLRRDSNKLVKERGYLTSDDAEIKRQIIDYLWPIELDNLKEIENFNRPSISLVQSLSHI